MAPLPAPAEKPSHRVSDSQSHAKVRPPTQVAVFCAALWPNLQPALTLASSFMVAIRLKKPASTVTHQTHLGNPGYETSQENPHDHMTRITYRLRTEPIHRIIRITPMSHPSLHTHIPECNSSMTHNQILCRSNHPHPSLTTTLSHCIITLLQEKQLQPYISLNVPIIIIKVFTPRAGTRSPQKI